MHVCVCVCVVCTFHEFCDDRGNQQASKQAMVGGKTGRWRADGWDEYARKNIQNTTITHTY